EVGLGRFSLVADAESRLGLNLGREPAGGAVSRGVEDGPLRLQVEGVIVEVVVALFHVGQVDVRKALLQRVAEAIFGEPVFGAQDWRLERDEVEEGAGPEGGIAEFILAGEVGHEFRRDGWEELEWR